MTPKALSMEITSVCSYCGDEYNYLLPTGYCVPCRKVLQIRPKIN